MLTFTMRRRGSFVTRFTSRRNQCGREGANIFKYECVIRTRNEWLDSRGFLIDNLDIQTYFEYAFVGVPGISCEQMAQKACNHIVETLQYKNIKLASVEVTIVGGADAALTATWTPEPLIPLVRSALPRSEPLRERELDKIADKKRPNQPSRYRGDTSRNAEDEDIEDDDDDAGIWKA